MLKMVMAKPMHVVIVMADPLTSGRAFCATKAENCGESATTINPQKIMIAKNNSCGKPNRKGDIKQQRPEQANATVATDLLPIFCEIKPPKRQPKNPEEIIISDQNEIEKSRPFNLLKMERLQGTNAQKAYNSHMWPK